MNSRRARRWTRSCGSDSPVCPRHLQPCANIIQVDAASRLGLLLASGAIACGYGHCIRSISTRKGWSPCGGRHCWPRQSSGARHAAIPAIPNWIDSRLTRIRAWRSIPTSQQSMRRPPVVVMHSIDPRSARSVRFNRFRSVLGNWRMSGIICSASWQRAVQPYLPVGVASLQLCVTRYSGADRGQWHHGSGLTIHSNRVARHDPGGARLNR
jgi:hypothetical protein